MSDTPRNQIVMFADVSGSAALFERLGDKEAMHAVERCLKRMSRSIEGYRGRTVQVVGDELLAAFGSPEDACHASIDMQQRIADLPPVSGLKLTIRIALHTGKISDENGKLSGPAITSAARIAGLARRDQILCSSALMAALPQSGLLEIAPMPQLGKVSEEDAELDIFQLHWPNPETISAQPHAMFGPMSVIPVERLCVRYRGKAFLLDDKTPVLTLGRDIGNKLVIEDRKASRQHARIERRGEGFYFVDTSTNGSFVAFAGRQEIMLRRNEILLEGRGRLCFGNSGNDPTSECAEFEYL